MEVTDPEALPQFRDHCESILVTSTKAALIQTSVGAETWKLMLSKTMKESPSQCALRIKWRPNYHGGHSFAAPAATDLQLQAVRAQANIHLQGRRPGSLPADFEATIELKGSLGPDPQNFLTVIMDTLAPNFRFPFQQAGPDDELQVGSWKILLAPGTDMPSGKIQIRLRSSEEAKLLEDVAHAMPVSVGGNIVALAVSNIKLQALPQCNLGNAAGVSVPGL